MRRGSALKINGKFLGIQNVEVSTALGNGLWAYAVGMARRNSIRYPLRLVHPTDAPNSESYAKDNSDGYDYRAAYSNSRIAVRSYH